MVESYDIAVKVISQEGTCAAGHKVGDEWVISATEYRTPGGICLSTFDLIFPYVTTLMYGGEIPWASKITSTRLRCIDPGNPVVFEISRLPR